MERMARLDGRGGSIDGSTLRQSVVYTIADVQWESVERTVEVGVLKTSCQADWLLLEEEQDGTLKRSVIEFEDNQATCSLLLVDEKIELSAGCAALSMQTLSIRREAMSED